MIEASSAAVAAAEIMPSDIYVDEEGDWFNQGIKIIRDDIIELFADHLQMTESGAFIIDYRRNRCLIKTADTPFVISRVDWREPDRPGGEESVLLGFRHLSAVEALDPATLYVGGKNVLYCRIQNGRFPARFSRPAYYQLAEHIQESPQDGGFYLELNGRRHTIPG